MMDFRKIILPVLSGLLLCTIAASAKKMEYADYVLPLGGTMSNPAFSTGNTYPATGRPWGMNFWTPQTGLMNNGWIYSYSADVLRGFLLTHQPSPWMGDYAQVAIMPKTVSSEFSDEKRGSHFSHKAETATPYYYSVYLADDDTFVEMSPTSRACLFRISYPEDAPSFLIIDASDNGSRVWVEDGRICGAARHYSSGVVHKDFTNWFIIEPDVPFDVVSDNNTDGGRGGMVVSFRREGGRQVKLKVASSFIDLEQAARNLAELGDGDFERIKAEGRAEWNDILGRIDIEDEDIDAKRVFYTCMYRSALFPRSISEIDAHGQRVHRSPHDGKVHSGHFFTDTGFWDTFRSLFAFVDWIYPDVAAAMQEGLVNCYLESGFLPEWASPAHSECMVGNNSASVVAEAWLKGLRGYDVETLWKGLIHGANASHPEIKSTGRLGWKQYNRLGYVPCDTGINESAARTLEYAYNDWCIYTLGKALGKPEKQLAQYRKNALNYRNLFRSDVRLMSGRRADGTFPEEFNPYKWGGDFTEGNALHYTWSVFHDPEGLISLMGGNEAFAESMDKVFTLPPIFDESYYGTVIHEIREMQVMNMGNYAHGNQPVQHMIYLYNWCGQPWKAQSLVREVMDKFYKPQADFYCGDEDNGQTSAWYIFSALGFYPVCPASCQYAIGSPLFRKATVKLPSSATLTITAPENDENNVYIKSVRLDGKEIDENYLTHDQLTKGGTLNFEMSPSACTERGVGKNAAPYSFSTELQ